MLNPEETFPYKICIIGGGPAGLCSLRHILSRTKDNVHVVLFEQQGSIGGVWNYQGPEVNLWDCSGKPMVFPMYNDLRCNLPKQLMEFHDFAHKETSHTFLTQQEIHDYLVDYANTFHLWPNIKLNCRVVNVMPLRANQPDVKWSVTFEDTKSFQRHALIFNAVVCCSGVNYYPRIPRLVGTKKFRGELLHSKYFKSVEKFKGKQVVLLGLGPSSADLCLQLSSIAAQVVACHRSPGGFNLGILPAGVREASSIKRLKKWSVVTENDEEIPCEVLILCTGYNVRFPYLDFGEIQINAPSCGLYKRMFLPKYQNLCFINAHGLVSEFLVMEVQVKYLVALLEGKSSLPPQNVMETYAAHEEKLMSKQGKLTEALRRGERCCISEVERYLTELAHEGDFASEFNHIPLQLAVWQCTVQRIFGSLAVYRRDQLQVINSNVWKYFCSQEKSSTHVVKTFQLCEDGRVVVSTSVD